MYAVPQCSQRIHVVGNGAKTVRNSANTRAVVHVCRQSGSCVGGQHFGFTMCVGRSQAPCWVAMPSNSSWSSCALATQSCCRCCALLRDERPVLGWYMSGRAGCRADRQGSHALLGLRVSALPEPLLRRSRPQQTRARSSRFLRWRLRRGQRGRKFFVCLLSCPLCPRS